MLELPGYKTLEKIYEGRHTLIFRGSDNLTNRPVIFKTINDPYPTPAAIHRLKREFEITARFQEGGVIQALKLENNRNNPVLILEDFGGVSLADILRTSPLAFTEFLSLSVRLAQILGEIHEHNIIHKDINPANIVWNRQRDILKIIDFGISLELSREITGIKHPNVLEGSLAFISPEQTGRMNRFLDYRTDYYSLGVTFFRMLAGRLPFESADAMEMVYAHIARQAPDLRELNANIPTALSAIVRKLMAKNVEDRYQSGQGLIADLKRCQTEFLDTGVIGDFTPGLSDVSDRFNIPQKIFGREDEIASLLNAFERASGGEKELLLLSGLPGIGKSALVNEIQKPIVKLRGNFINGKYDKFKKDVPYHALLQAFSGLVKHILAEDQERLAEWKQKILQALGPNGRVITDVIPDLELVIGKQPDLPALGPDESRNRFNLYFQYFMGVFCKARHPLVLFLDDLQWADYASLEMIKLFLSDPEVKHLFVIGTYRNNEVDDSHPLTLILDEIKKTAVRVSSRALRPLDLEAICKLLAESLHCSLERGEPLAKLLLLKTGGNPFFLGEFLKTLYRQESLFFEVERGWTWDTQKIEALEVTDNVVELMAAKIESIPGSGGDLLKIGACSGNHFTLEDLSELSGKPVSEILVNLNILLEEGLLIKLDTKYKFAHDRILEAAYSLISEDERIQEHLRIGRLKLKRCAPAQLPRNVFEIVNQLNAARSLIISEEQKLELARLNLLAGGRARASAAYRPALDYLGLSLELMGKDAWERQYDLTLALHQEATGAAYLCGDYEQMDRLADSVIDNARNVLDTVKVYEIKIFAAQSRNLYLQAVEIGLLILERLGVRLPRRPGKIHILLGLLSLQRIKPAKLLLNLDNTAELTEPRKLAGARILSGLISSAFIGMPDLMPLLIFEMLNLSIKHGNTPFSPYSAYAAYGMVLCGILGNIEKGYQFGELARKVSEKLNVQEGKTRALFLVPFAITSWKEHLRNTLPSLKQAVRSGMETGDPEFSCYSAVSYIEYAFFSGCELGELERENTQFIGMIAKHNQLFSLHQSHLDRQILLNFLGHSEDPHILKGASYDYEKMLPVHIETNDQNNIFRIHFYHCILNYSFGRYEQAHQYINLAEPHRKSLQSYFAIALLDLYNSLTKLALYPGATKSQRRNYLSGVNTSRKRLKKWAGHASMNFEHKYRLVEAELARIRGRESEARKHYEGAIQGAHENRYTNEEALALELFAKFWLELKQIEIASLYMGKARQAYRTWGALAKVKHLEKTYPQLFSPPLGPEFSAHEGDPGYTAEESDRIHTSKSITQTTEEETTRQVSGKLDLETVIKGSQAIAGEIQPGNLLRKMLQIVMENAGARSGYFILDNKDGFFVEAMGNLENEDIQVLESRPLESYPELCRAIVQYAARTKETVVLSDAANIGPFASDPQVVAHKPKSILCAPILNQGKLRALLYLENNLSAGAFTADRLKVLGILSSQIAVSIDNARLYANLEDKVQERTQELKDSLDQVQALKTKQDGDYFLTSLLINPLARNEVVSKRVVIDFLVEQKKQFTFRKWEEELGGDLCIAHSVILENRPHTVFLNADAMGKSMQGAGGALVLGAVFQSIIERTRLDSFDKTLLPRNWLREVTRELQNVFESFSGSMLVSLVLGVVNDDSGAMYFINADHPRTVLYRGGQARFIEEAITLSKLGSAIQPEDIKVYQTRLQPGDVLIAGSDGRDDLLLPTDLPDAPEDNRFIYGNEEEFLQRVQEGRGNLSAIKAGLLKQGELFDDLSLVRLEYN